MGGTPQAPVGQAVPASPAPSAPTGGRHSLPYRISRGHAVLHVTALAAYAVAQPLFDLVGRNTSFLIHHGVDRLDLAVITAAAGLGVPLALTAVLLLLGAGSPARLHLVYRALVVLLATLFALASWRSLGDPLPFWLGLPAALALGLLATRALERFAPLRSVLGLLAVALPVFILTFLLSPGVRGLLTTPAIPESATSDTWDPSDTSDSTTHTGPPIFFVVFDGLPLLSLLDEDSRIDAGVYPHLAALASRSTWYRNASTVWAKTTQSIVSMLTGRLATEDTVATLDHHPENLLTWLAATHEVDALEHTTRLAPPTPEPVLSPSGDQGGKTQPRRPRGQRLRQLLFDLGVVYLHRISPPEIALHLPTLDNKWGGFWRPRRRRPPATATATPTARLVWEFALHDRRGADFEALLNTLERGERPRFDFIHVDLPHLPARFLPSGKVYGGRAVYGKRAWYENEWFALETFQRHLLQVRYVDHLVGRLVARLEELDLFDETLIVIVSDHGASHWPGESRREIADMNHPQDVLRVPLLIKAPFQAEDRLDDRNVQTIDLAPTLADLMGRRLPWAVDGRSAVRGEAAAGDKVFPPLESPQGDKVLRDEGGIEMRFAPGFAVDNASRERQFALFDPAGGLYRFHRLGPYGHLLGHTVDELPTTATGSCNAMLDQHRVLSAYDPAERYAPVQLTGRIECSEELANDRFLAFALAGRLHATAPVQPDGSAALFSAFVPTAVLGPGDNEPRLYLIAGTPEDFRLDAVEFE